MSNIVNPCNWQQVIEECEYYQIDTEEFKKLNLYLGVNSLPGGCTSVVIADGFLTGLVIGPDDCRRQPNQGLEVVWGEMPSTQSKYKKMSKRKQRMEDVLSRRTRTIFYFLEHDRGEYAPLIGTRSDNRLDATNRGKSPPPFIEWCRGFMKFVDLHPEAWAPIFDTVKGRTLMTPFIYFGTGDDWRKKMHVKYDLFTYDDVFTDHLQYFVFSIKDYFRAPHFMEDMYWFRQEIAKNWSVPSKYLKAGLWPGRKFTTGGSYVQRRLRGMCD